MGDLFTALFSSAHGVNFNSALRLLITIYIIWGLMWSLVAYHYGKVSLATWHQQGGTWKMAIPDLFAPFLFGWYRALCKIRLIKDTEACRVQVPEQYTVGHYLRFSIFLGALSPMVLTLLVNSSDRARWTLFEFILACVILIVSTVGAAGHLYLVYRLRPSAWSRIVVFSTLWVLLAPLFFNFINWP